jgi:hypothetical protein
MKLQFLSPIAMFSLCVMVLAVLVVSLPLLAAEGAAISATKARVIEHWSAERRATAIPRDLVIDPRGQGFLRRPDGTLRPYGHRVSATTEEATMSPAAKPVSGDNTPPVISQMDPAQGDVIGGSHTFSATVTDASGVKFVNFIIRYPDGNTTSIIAYQQSGTDRWSRTIQGFSDSSQWAWWVEAKDNGIKGGNPATSQTVGFTVDTGVGASGGGSDSVTNAEWSAGGAIQTAAGRLYFEMPRNSRRKSWLGYVCSGSVAADGTSGRSIILTAAHCVYDDENKAFARNVMFIPDQARTTANGTDLDCNNDPLGCWVPSYGTVDLDWATRTFPDNIEWDYAFYVVDDSDAHAGSTLGGTILDSAAGALAIQFTWPYVDDGVEGRDSYDFTHALGYSYSEDPRFMYCAEDMTTNGTVNWWLPSCGLSGGSSGGPWLQPLDTGAGSGPIISVNSWGYTTQPGMAGPKLPAAECLFTVATTTAWGSVSTADGEAGMSVDCP